jgi:phosphoserine phosphatase RsbU/P
LRVSAEKERLDQEMKIAAQVQAQLFPRSLPSTTALDFAPGVCLPARQVSGDYYDFLDVTPGVTGIVIADVCGKGVSAALLMANLQAHLRGQVQACHEIAAHPCPVSEIVKRVNRLMAATAPDASYVTLCYAEFDERTSMLRYTNAGHNPPLLWRNTGECERLDCGGMVVGMFAEASYDEAVFELQPGDLFIAFTDGLIEAHTPLGVEFGEERVIRVLEQHATRSPEEVKQALLAAVQRWTGGLEQEDDLTLIVFKRL